MEYKLRFALPIASNVFLFHSKEFGGNNSEASASKELSKDYHDLSESNTNFGLVIAYLKGNFRIFYAFKEITETKANYKQNMVG